MESKIPSSEQAYWGLRAMKTVALADGTLDDAELHLLASLGLAEEPAAEIRADERAELCRGGDDGARCPCTARAQKRGDVLRWLARPDLIAV